MSRRSTMRLQLQDRVRWTHLARPPHPFHVRPRACLVALSCRLATDVTRAIRTGLVCILLVAVTATAVHAQAFRGSTASTLGGVALGAYSGSVLGLLGSVLPCNRTLYGPKCAATGASVGGALGVAMGGLIGSQNQDETIVRLEGAGVGVLIGSGVGIILQRAVRQYDWKDAVTVGVIGGAVGATPIGSGVGLGAGAVVGGVVWLVFPQAGLQDFILFSLAGAAVGGMIDWADGAASAKREGLERGFPLSFSVPVGS